MKTVTLNSCSERRREVDLMMIVESKEGEMLTVSRVSHIGRTWNP